MKLSEIVCRFMIPAPLKTVYYFLACKAFVSMKAEVEISRNLNIGKKARISSYCKIKASHGPLHIGRNAQIAVSCFISSGKAGLYIGDDVLIGPHVSIVASNYGYDDLATPMRLQEHTSKGVTIGNNVWLGAGAVILDGAKIGNGCIIVPNSVISGVVPDNSIVQGNPAKVIFIRR